MRRLRGVAQKYLAACKSAHGFGKVGVETVRELMFDLHFDSACRLELMKEEAAKFKEGKTAVVKNSLNPRWDEACELVMPTAISTSGDARVELTMFDW